MKILAGKYKGRNIYMPAGIRPTQNMTRKAIFDILGHDLEGLAVLELFAGSGAVGLEALSLGAEATVFVERESLAVETIQQNLLLLGINSDAGARNRAQAEVIQGDAMAAIKQMAAAGRRFNVIFVDPPYEQGQAKKALKTLEGYDILQPNCIVIIEHSQRETVPEENQRLAFITQRKYGNSLLTIFQAK